jgi:hypothetical protein
VQKDCSVRYIILSISLQETALADNLSNLPKETIPQVRLCCPNRAGIISFVVAVTVPREGSKKSKSFRKHAIYGFCKIPATGISK